MIGQTSMSGALSAKLIRAKRASLKWRLSNVLRWAYIKGWLAVKVGTPIAKAFGLFSAVATLEGKVIKADGEVINYGVLGHRVVTTAFVNFMVDQLQTETSAWGDFKYHDSGVGTTAEDVGDTAMETTDGEDRVAGTQVEGDPNQYRSVGTIAYTTTKAITEHGLFNTTDSATLMDRTVFSAINVVNGDSIQFTYTLTCTAGS
jgi:hypothetical protein